MKTKELLYTKLGSGAAEIHLESHPGMGLNYTRGYAGFGPCLAFTGVLLGYPFLTRSHLAMWRWTQSSLHGLLPQDYGW